MFPALLESIKSPRRFILCFFVPQDAFFSRASLFATLSPRADSIWTFWPFKLGPAVDQDRFSFSLHTFIGRCAQKPNAQIK